VIAWLAITAVAFVYEFFVALIILYGLLFTGGRIAGWIALVLIAAMFVSTPAICGWLLVRLGRNYPRLRAPSTRAGRNRARARYAQPLTSDSESVIGRTALAVRLFVLD
jgi:hypothetical protein